jgi:DNA-binding response OmpR family regulator
VVVRLLVVEDDEYLVATLERGLRRAGFAVDTAGDGAEALHQAAVNRYDLVVLDRGLPGVHGDEVCAALRAASVPVVMLTAAGDVGDRIRGLNLGADDYVTKPFHFDELVARLRAVGRRGHPSRAPVIERGDLRVDTATGEVSRAGTPIALTAKELGVLEALLTADGALVSAESLLETVWDEHADPFTNAVRMTITKLRRKLGAPSPIVTSIGKGYRIP